MTCPYTDPLAVLNHLMTISPAEEGCQLIDKLYAQACQPYSPETAQARSTICLLLGVMPRSIKCNFFCDKENAPEILAYLQALPLHWSYADHFTNTLW